MYKQEDFERLARTYIKREGIDNILTTLSNTDFYTAPASTKFHDSCAGGLCHHSVRVFDELVKEWKGEYGTVTELDIMESLAVVSLFHDICKIGYYVVSSRNVKNETTGKWQSVPYYSVDDKFPLGHGEKSLFMVRDMMELSSEEALAIRWHMNGFEPKENYNYVSKTYGSTPMALLLAVADLKATYLPENNT